MPKPETFLRKRAEPKKAMSKDQWRSFASAVLGKPITAPDVPPDSERE